MESDPRRAALLAKFGAMTQAELVEALVAAELAKDVEEGVPGESNGYEGRGPQPLAEVMRLLNARIACISAPELGGPPVAGPGGELLYTVPTMKCLECLANELPEWLIAAYDFAGSASTLDCKAQVPDCTMAPHQWAVEAEIKKTQWFRYWMGGTRKTFSTMLMGARPLSRKVVVGNWACVPGQRFLFVVSIAGGPITQAEKSEILSLMCGAQADLSTREVNVGEIFMYWLHFETVEEFIKALQGYGNIFLHGISMRNSFDEPGRWSDGPYSPQHDLLRGVPGDTPEERRQYLLQPLAPSQEAMNQRLGNSIFSKSLERVVELLAIGADPNATLGDGFTSLQIAVVVFNVPSIEVLLAAGADAKDCGSRGVPPLFLAQAWGQKVLDGDGWSEEAKVRVRTIIDLLAQAELGMPWVQYEAKMVVGAAVTFEGTVGKIVEERFVHSGGGLVAAVQSPKGTQLYPVISLRLA
eukprot:SAG25_NODE_1616_length_2665_cov_3.756430_2_plen_469_part_00